jgi:histone deacetylase HOS3
MAYSFHDLLAVTLDVDAESARKHSIDVPGAVLADHATALGNSKNPRNKGTVVFLQDLCFKHRYIRSRDTSLIFERPQRLRAVNLGLSAAMACLQQLVPSDSESVPEDDGHGSDHDLAVVLDRMTLEPARIEVQNLHLTVVQSAATTELRNNPSVAYVHSNSDYLKRLESLAKGSHDKITAGGSEIPEELSQGDLYRKLPS